MSTKMNPGFEWSCGISLWKNLWRMWKSSAIPQLPPDFPIPDSPRSVEKTDIMHPSTGFRNVLRKQGHLGKTGYIFFQNVEISQSPPIFGGGFFVSTVGEAKPPLPSSDEGAVTLLRGQAGKQ